MATAKWNGEIIAESDTIIHLEGVTYFPPTSIRKYSLRQTSDTYKCPWKGLANYYDISMKGKLNPSAAFIYHNPKEAAKEIKGWVSFWRGVKIKETGKETVTELKKVE